MKDLELREVLREGGFIWGFEGTVDKKIFPKYVKDEIQDLNEKIELLASHLGLEIQKKQNPEKYEIVKKSD